MISASDKSTFADNLKHTWLDFATAVCASTTLRRRFLTIKTGYIFPIAVERFVPLNLRLRGDHELCN